jgi:hypothetical protein
MVDFKDPKTKKTMWIATIIFCVVFVVLVWYLKRTP